MSYFSKLFNKRKGLTKLEFWEKFELKKLIEDLNIAQSLLEETLASKDLELNKFKEEFDEMLYNVSSNNVPDFTQVWFWFKPQGKWNELLNNEELRSRIYLIADRWKRNNEFVNGTKVKMNDEFGLVLIEDGKEIIRWDTDKELDSEDWTGQFGVFIEIGGFIIDQNQQFEYIDENGKLKKRS